MNTISFEAICKHTKNLRKSNIKLIPGVIYKGGNTGNMKDEQLSKLMKVANTGGMRSKNTVYGATAYVVLNITYKNNTWKDYVDYKEMKVIYYGDNSRSKDMYDTKHKGNKRLKHLYDNISFPEKQFPLFLFERDASCVNRDFKYIGIAVPRKGPDGLVVEHEEHDGTKIENYKASLTLTQDVVDFKWIADLIDGIKPIESKYCPVEWKKQIQLLSNDNYVDKIYTK